MGRVTCPNENLGSAGKRRDVRTNAYFINTVANKEEKKLLLGWPTSSLGFFRKMLQKNPNKRFGQPINVRYYYCCFH